MENKLRVKDSEDKDHKQRGSQELKTKSIFQEKTQLMGEFDRQAQQDLSTAEPAGPRCLGVHPESYQTGRNHHGS